MSTIQLELNIDDASDNDIELAVIQKQIDSMKESMGKVRRKLFAEVGSLKKTLTELANENESLKHSLLQLQDKKTEWTYGQNGLLFDIKELKQA
jgi:predicted  nucleic acid-binding Zn-ribbon protein